MKKYSKGTTLVEIMVSVVLISIVMIFIFSILVDLKNEYSLASKRSEDSINRAALMRIIQNDLINNTLVRITECNNSSFCLNFIFKDNTIKQFMVFDNYIVYDSSNASQKEKWDLVGGKYNLSGAKICYYASAGNELHYLKINVPSSFNTSSNRKYDIEINHYGKGQIDMASINKPINQC